MNDYRITYTGENEGYQTITERSEAAAKKAFLSINKGIKLDITSIDLYRENTPATKAQERETLEAIRKMVEELGPQSHITAAFEGCFEDAEINIENDFIDSYKRRFDDAWEKLGRAKQETVELEMHKRLMQQTIDRLQQERDEMEAQLNFQNVSNSDLAYLAKLAEKDLAEAEQRRDDAAQKIVAHADNPSSEEFRQAVRDHRNAQASVEAKKERLGRLNAIKDAV